MPFPEVPRVIYANNPLVEVVCEVRFPPILRISAADPTDFQDQIRSAYPEYEVGNVSGPLVPNAPDFLRSLLQSGFQDPSFEAAPRGYRFLNADQSWKVTLSQGSLSLSTSTYERWEGFRERLESVIGVLVKTYQPSYFSRVGLRYQNVISTQNLGLEEGRWRDLLARPVLGELSSEELQDVEVIGARRSMILSIDEDLMLNLNHGFVDTVDDQGEAYLIDTDYYQEGQIDTNDCLSHAERCHSYAGKVFRWCITDKLHDALGPALA